MKVINTLLIISKVVSRKSALLHLISLASPKQHPHLWRPTAKITKNPASCLPTGARWQTLNQRPQALARSTAFSGDFWPTAGVSRRRWRKTIDLYLCPSLSYEIKMTETAPSCRKLKSPSPQKFHFRSVRLQSKSKRKMSKTQRNKQPQSSEKVSEIK